MRTTFHTPHLVMDFPPCREIPVETGSHYLKVIRQLKDISEFHLPLIEKPEILPERFYQKLSADDIDESIKNQFLEACAGCDCETLAHARDGGGESPIEAAYNEFCADLQTAGNPISLLEGERLGRVTNLRGAAAYIAKGLKQSLGDVLEKFFWLNDLSPTPATPSQISDARDWLEDLKQATDPNTGLPFAISPPVCWLFRSKHDNNDANDDMLNGAECLPCRLGLPDLLNDEQILETGLDFLCMIVSASGAKNVRSSNFCHSGYLGVRDIWEPDGSTAPIPYGPPACVEQGGLPEVICDAVSYVHVVEPIRIVRT